MIIQVTIPEKVSMNLVKGMNWRRWYAIAQMYHMEFLGCKERIPEDWYPVSIKYDWHFAGTALDTLNTALMGKLLEDGMVKAKVLKDDSPKYVRRTIIESQKSKAFKLDTCIITVERFVP